MKEFWQRKWRLFFQGRVGWSGPTLHNAAYYNCDHSERFFPLFSVGAGGTVGGWAWSQFLTRLPVFFLFFIALQWRPSKLHNSPRTYPLMTFKIFTMKYGLASIFYYSLLNINATVLCSWPYHITVPHTNPYILRN